MRITKQSIQGKRPYQEDTFFVRNYHDESFLLAVFDGHGGPHTSAFLKKNASKVFRTVSSHNAKATPISALHRTYELLNQYLTGYANGSTASMVFVSADKTKAYVAILGDSPVFILDKNGNIWKSPEHNVRTNALEAERAIARGGIIWRGYLFDGNQIDGPGLQMSRALGDTKLHNVLLREPELFEIELGPNSWILCGSDGLVDESHSNPESASTITNLILNNPKITAEDLVNNAVTLGSTDNITAIFVNFSE